MKNTYETDGLSREKRSELAATDLPLQVLEDNLPVLLKRVLRKSNQFSAFYKYQPLIVLLEIERIDTNSLRDTFHSLKEEKDRIAYIRALLLIIEGWRLRLNSASLYGSQVQLLSDLNEQIELNLASWFPAFASIYKVAFEPGEMGVIWYPCTAKKESDVPSKRFSRRFFYYLLASISILQTKKNAYKEEICSMGTMDPSLAVLIAFLKNQGEIISRFNQLWRQLPLYYYNEILKVRPRVGKTGKTWITFCTDQVTHISVEKILFITVEKNKVCHPEASLGFATALSQITIPENKKETLTIGVELKSDVLLMYEGKRKVTLSFTFEADSLAYLKRLVAELSLKEGISEEEARYKMTHETFSIEISTTEGWLPVHTLAVRPNKAEKLKFEFTLNTDFPAVVPLGGETKPAVRITLCPGAWLFAYSWAKRVRVSHIHIKADVSGVKEMSIYNELGMIDTNQPFSPFGNQGQKGMWMAFGNYEMTRKKVRKVALDFHWQHIPNCAGGLEQYYKEYRQDITNRSFQVKTQYLRNNEWKATQGDEFHYLFRTHSQTEPPRVDEALSENSRISFELPETDRQGKCRVDDFIFGQLHFGFYRLILSSPEMGFGEKEYRRIFAETMIKNSRQRKKMPLPEEPVSPLMDGPRLSYEAEEECHFSIGQSSGIDIVYIRPLSDRVELSPVLSSPIPFVEGSTDEGNLMIGLAGVIGENIISLYIESEPLQKETVCANVPVVHWYYKDVSSWVQIKSADVLVDDTGSLRYSGVVKFQLPVPVSSEMLDSDGLFWVCLAVQDHLIHCAMIRNVYSNIAEVDISQEKGVTVSIPGLTSYWRVGTIRDCCPCEDNREMSIRISERISHRNRALLPRDYEELVLQEFPKVAKVKCLVSVDVFQSRKNGVVTLVIINERQGDEWPLCDEKLLCDVECFIKKKISPFVHINVVNPKYEEVTVFCGISIKKGYSAGTIITEVLGKIRSCIAPWADTDKPPCIGYSFSVRDLQGIISDTKGLNHIHGIKLIHQMSDGSGELFTNENISNKTEECIVRPSEPRAILVPAISQYVIVCTQEQWRDSIEYGDLEIEQTFVIS